ncbi:triose-phosphate isomerase [Aurantimonas sp. Leaf443]|uniref:triose-phosphate isomerase n=1 Tax=Aurantimonas sp. Leaf443 TaxID=1736378 RepID=UPI00070070FC|nr:triose-phosphate isomerase [Aurantimonas sp. Leaf443]KQT83585.1 triosephosphate isomerase [Aurantimonas sp. Leaf443]
MRPKPLIAGNWKMNGTRASLAELKAVAEAAGGLGARLDLLLCPPATLLAAAVEAADGRIAVGAQDCHGAESGAHTGDVSAAMIADCGAGYVIVGHSERRADHGESDALVRAKAQAARAAGLVSIVCVGETEAERVDGTTLDVLGAQIDGSLSDDVTGADTVVAYEPVWAIGTGKTPTAADVKEVHDFLRGRLAERFGMDAAASFRLLYGGSVKPANAAELLGVDNVDGALVGGASLKAADFLGIARACPARG